jgi:Autographiviridae endonuclease VII
MSNSAYVAKWARLDRIKNPEKWREKSRLRYKKNREKILSQVKKYQEANPEKIKSRKRAKYLSDAPEIKMALNLKRNYGITLDEYQRIYDLQNGRCAICGNKKQRLFVDHCHESKKIRGLLCNNCNFGIGHFKDNPALLAAAIHYLLPTSE